MNSQPPPFEDPSLRQALRHLATDRPGSALLRERVARAMAAEPVGTAPLTPAVPVAAASNVARWLKLTAVIVVGTGVGMFVLDRYVVSDHPRMPITSGSYSVPAVWMAMATLHDCGAGGDGGVKLDAAFTQPVALADEATKKLGRRVPVPAFAGTNWKIDGASYGNVGGFRGVRFHLTDGTKAITVVSLPENAWMYRTSETYAASINEHELAGYVKDGGLHCVIGDRPISPTEIKTLADQLRAQ